MSTTPSKSRTTAKKTSDSDAEAVDVSAELPLKSDAEIANEVLTGVWGPYEGLRDRLTEAKYDPSAVLTVVNQRLSRGAPSAYKASAFELAQQVQNGEWGEEKGLQQRLQAAGLSSVDALAVLKPSSRTR